MEKKYFDKKKKVENTKWKNWIKGSYYLCNSPIFLISNLWFWFNNSVSCWCEIWASKSFFLSISSNVVVSRILFLSWSRADIDDSAACFALFNIFKNCDRVD